MISAFENKSNRIMKVFQSFVKHFSCHLPGYSRWDENKT
jgi:hypothetical protein